MAYVNLDLVKESLLGWYPNLDDKQIEYMLDTIPTAEVVEVVRCRNCMHCEIAIDQFDNDWYFCKKTKDNAEVKADHFCSYGERRDT